jgi:RNA polymerase sigma factor (sigma-70 family)
MAGLLFCHVSLCGIRQSIAVTRPKDVTVTDSPEDRLARSFEANRPHLRAVAYRMLGSTAEADDVVQDAWLRLSRTDVSAVENMRGWLTTVVARLSLDALRVRKSRREEAPGLQLPEPVVTDVASDPEESAVLADVRAGALAAVRHLKVSTVERELHRDRVATTQAEVIHHQGDERQCHTERDQDHVHHQGERHLLPRR